MVVSLKDMIMNLIGYSNCLALEEEIEAAAGGRYIEDVALDYSVERCSDCGVWGNHVP